ncbi:Transposon TX1 uncharacterized 149 kDa protein [Vitis vinifera]|uniref:Transposon TX1 uncharacterized 149 kDa protein n=1 Tax=Vitis vinifera TaxID=29760 RepID=A0A438JFX0_VITVI|nr:Transposon TX1 uncharacterized 149 kDa protein [Vitis vinifera]
MLLETMGRDDVEELEVPFIEDKVVSTLNSINVDKAPRISMSFTFLVLIPKKGGVEEFKDFRPISLVSGFYKLLAKIFAASNWIPCWLLSKFSGITRRGFPFLIFVSVSYGGTKLFVEEGKRYISGIKAFGRGSDGVEGVGKVKLTTVYLGLPLANFDAIEQVGGFTSDLLNQRALRKWELEELILREEIHWRQKAKVKWLRKGIVTLKFFHKVANGRRNKKYIKVLENERGLVLNNAESIIEEILLYFEKLYASPTGESWSIEGLDWSPISEESALRLDSPFTEEEISKAIFQLGRDKAAGPDGFTIAVFQDCWDVIKEDLVRVFAEFHRNRIINQSTNASFIVLLPKKSLTKKISNFRPISLITSLYKIIAKVLSGRLRGVLHETIHSTQGAFVQGRQILNAVLIANEIVDERRRSGEEGVVFKIDFEKAYDHVRWDFLDQVLEKKSAKGWVKASRGLRQDDTIFFSNTKEEDLQTFKSLLLVFGHIFGLKVNLDKSNIYDINLDQNHLSRLAEMLDCKASGWPILYLGLPLGGNPKACGFRIQ